MKKEMKDLGHETGETPSHRIPIYDHKGNVRGHVGRTATSATIARFTGHHGAKLGKKDGRDAWIADRPPPPPVPPLGQMILDGAAGEEAPGGEVGKPGKSEGAPPKSKSKVPPR